MNFCQQAGVFHKMHNYYTDLQLHKSHISSWGEKDYDTFPTFMIYSDKKALNGAPIDSL